MKRTALAAVLTAALILAPTAALANGNPGNGKDDKCLTDSSHASKHHHFYGWGHCRTTQPTTGGPGPTPTHTKTPKPTHTKTPRPSPSHTYSATPTTGSTSSTSSTATFSPSTGATTTQSISATSDSRLPATGYPLSAWLVGFFVLVAAGVALAVPYWTSRRGGKA